MNVDTYALKAQFKNTIDRKDYLGLLVLAYRHKDFIYQTPKMFKRIESIILKTKDPDLLVPFLRDFEGADEQKIVDCIVENRLIENLQFLDNLSEESYQKIKKLILQYGDEFDIVTFAEATGKDTQEFQQAISYSSSPYYREYKIKQNTESLQPETETIKQTGSVYELDSFSLSPDLDVKQNTLKLIFMSKDFNFDFLSLCDMIDANLDDLFKNFFLTSIAIEKMEHDTRQKRRRGELPEEQAQKIMDDFIDEKRRIFDALYNKSPIVLKQRFDLEHFAFYSIDGMMRVLDIINDPYFLAEYMPLSSIYSWGFENDRLREYKIAQSKKPLLLLRLARRQPHDAETAHHILSELMKLNNDFNCVLKFFKEYKDLLMPDAESYLCKTMVEYFSKHSSSKDIYEFAQVWRKPEDLVAPLLTLNDHKYMLLFLENINCKNKEPLFKALLDTKNPYTLQVLKRYCEKEQNPQLTTLLAKAFENAGLDFEATSNDIDEEIDII